MKIPRIILPYLLFCLSSLFGGCLIYQTIEYRLTLNSDGKSVTLSIRYTNIESSSTDTAKQREDFNELIGNWRGDKYLLERMDDGVYLKKRALSMVHGVLVWNETGIFSDVARMKDGVKYDDTTRITVGKDQTVLSTNGTVLLTKDSTVVSWPPHTREFHIRIQQRDFQPTSHFAERFKSLGKK